MGCLSSFDNGNHKIVNIFPIFVEIFRDTHIAFKYEQKY